MVVFRFRPESFMRGMAVSGGTAVFLLIAAAVSFRRGRANRAALSGEASESGGRALTETGAGGGPDISIIIPIYNEAPFLVDAVRAIIGEMREKVEGRFELILAENGSRDSTIPVAESLERRISGRHLAC